MITSQPDSSPCIPTNHEIPSLHVRCARQPNEDLRRGDLATVVDYYEESPGQEPGYEFELFNAVGDLCARDV